MTNKYFDEQLENMGLLFSVGNEEKEYIAECIDSILSQLPENSELIVADDGSEDDTRSVLAQYEGRQENLHILYEAHRG